MEEVEDGVDGRSCVRRHIARAATGGKEVDGDGGQGPVQHAREAVLCPLHACSAWFLETGMTCRLGHEHG